MKKILAFLLFIIFITILSCVKELDVELIPESPLLVLNCAVVADSTWLVSLTRSGNILDYHQNNFPVIGAEIAIRNEKNEIIETLEPYKPEVVKGKPTPYTNYNYRGKTVPVPGKIYSIVAKVADEVIQASSKIPSPVKLVDVEIDSFHYNSDRDVEMKLSFKDPGEEKNYYQIKIFRDILQIPSPFINGVPTPDSSKAYLVKYTFPYYSEGLIPELYTNDTFADDLFNGKNYELRFKVQNFERYNSDFPVHVVLITMSKEYYDYFSSAKLAQDAEGNPLLQPVQIYTNIENGLGIFAGYSVSEILIE